MVSVFVLSKTGQANKANKATSWMGTISMNLKNVVLSVHRFKKAVAKVGLCATSAEANTRKQTGQGYKA